MKIFDETTNQSISDITILLRKHEITQFIGYLECLLLDNAEGAHYHLNDDDYSKEITIALYNPNGSLDHFAEKYRKVIFEDM